MSFQGWKNRVKLIIKSSEVPSDLTNFPVLINKSNIPAEVYITMFGNAARSDGGDIRFSLDAQGNTKLPCEVSRFVQTYNDYANADVEIWVRIPFISSVNNTEFYMWYGKHDATQPPRNDPIGMEAVWANNYKAVWHFSEGWNTLNNGFNESTSSQKHGTGSFVLGNPTVTTISGNWGGRAIDCTFTNYSNVWRITASGTAPLNYNIQNSTISVWVRRREPQTGWFLSKGSDNSIDWFMRGLSSSNDAKAWWNRTAGDGALKSTGTFPQNTWAMLHFTVSTTGNLTFYINGNSSGNFPGIFGSQSGTLDIRIGTGSGDMSARYEAWLGAIDELRLHNIERSANYILFEYRTTAFPSHVIIPTAPTRIGKSNFIPFLLGI